MPMTTFLNESIERSTASSDAANGNFERMSSPSAKDIEDALAQGDLKRSPTRVLDFDEEAKEDLRSDGPSSNSNSIFRKQLAPPAIAKTPSSRRKASSPAKGGSLPTLDESSSSDEEIGSSRSFEEEDEEDARRRSRDFIGPMLQKSQMRRPAPGRKAGNREKIDELEQTASSLAMQGSEQDALEVYQQALLITRTDVSRIKKQLKQVTAKHPSTVESIHSRLHEDWLQVGLSIARIRTMMAILFERLGDHEHAIECCKEAREVYKRQVGYVKKWKINVDSHVDADAEQMEVMVQKMSLAQETFEDRKKLHEEIIMWRTKLAVTQDEEMKKTLYRTVMKKVTTVRNLEVDILGEGHPQVADTYSLLATIALEQNDIVQALENMEEALSITELSLGMKHPRTGEKFIEIARIYEKRRGDAYNEQLAIENYQQAAEVFRESSASPRRVGSILNDIAVIHIRRREYDAAVKLLSDALDCYESATTEKADTKDEICTDTVQIWRNLGESYASRKEYENAANAFVSALNLQRDARKMKDAVPSSPPVDFVDDESIANTLRRLGKAYAGMGKFRHALVVMKEALVIHRLEVSKAMQVTKGRSNPDLPGKQDQLAHTRFCMAEVHEQIGNYTDAVTLYSESLQLRLFSDAHKGAKERSNMVHCSMCLAGIGSIHMKKNEFDEAYKVFKDALNYCEAHGISENHKIVLMIQHRLKEAAQKKRVHL